MLRVAIVSMCLVCAVLAAAPSQAQTETKTEQQIGPLPMQAILSPKERVDLVDRNHRELAFQLTGQVEERAKVTRMLQEIVAKLSELGKTKEKRSVADDGVEQMKKDTELAADRLLAEASSAQKLEDKLTVLTKSLQTAEANSKMTAEQADSMVQRSMELQSQLDSMKKDTEQLIAVAQKVKNVVSKDTRKKRDTTLRAVEALADTMVSRAEDLLSKISSTEETVLNVKQAAEKISSATADNERDIHEQVIEANAAAKDAAESKADGISAMDDVKQLMVDLDHVPPVNTLSPPATSNELH